MELPLSKTQHPKLPPSFSSQNLKSVSAHSKFRIPNSCRTQSSIDLTGDSPYSVRMKADSTPREQPVPENRRGMPSWRTRQRSLPVAEKIALLGRFIQETRQLERVKKQCKLSAMS